MKEQQFENIWNKNGKMKNKILGWLKVRNLEPTYENARDYWLGRIKPFKEPNTGETQHLNTETDWRIIRRWRNNGKSQRNSRQNPRKNKRFK
jgi:hypothetical protein